MLGAARQLRSRGNKTSANNATRGKPTDGPKRRVFGDASNRPKKTADNTDDSKPAAKRTVSSLVVEGVAKLRRSARSSADSNESNELGQTKRPTRKQIREECEPIGTKLGGKSKKQKITRDEEVTEPAAPQRTSRSANREEEIESKPQRSRSRGTKEIVEVEKPAIKAKRGTRSAQSVEDAKEPTAKRVKRSAAAKPKKSSAKVSKSKPKNVAASKKKTATKTEGGKRRSRTKAPKYPKKASLEHRELCSDFFSDSNYTLVRVPFDASKYTPGIAAHDEHSKDDPLEVSSYVTDLFQRLYHSEELHQPHLYMEDQDEINSMMRAILVDWLVEVHMKFKLAPESLYLCVNIIDRYCGQVEVERRKLQLVGVTALLLACKYEEIYPPEVRDCVYITDRAYTRQEVLNMEQDIVKTLQFKLTVPTGYPFLVRYLLVAKSPSKAVRAAAQYYMERTLQEYEFIQYRPSLVAAAAVCLALNNPGVRSADGIVGAPPGIPESLLEYTGYHKDEILDVGKNIAEIIGEEVVTASQRQLVACKKKFGSEEYCYVSTDMADPELNHLMV